MNSFGQSKNYYSNKAGLVIDQATYDAQKMKSLENIKRNMKEMEIVEDLSELYKNDDSIVYSYHWHFTDNPKKTIKSIESKKAIIGKKIPLAKEKNVKWKKHHFR